jgi:hypothetical protein
MKAYEYILSKQTQWAFNRGIPLIGSRGPRGRPAYTPEIHQNLFQPLEPATLDFFKQGNGNETTGSAESPAKIQALHSSSALGINVFQYWQKIKQAPLIAAACGFCREGNDTSVGIVFEDKYRIDPQFDVPPNIDIVFHNSATSRVRRFAVECKFTEPYSTKGHQGLKAKYVSLDEAWKDIPATYALAKSISPNDNQFRHLHVAQLIKHILGLKAAFGKGGFRLLYLWYDVLGMESAAHRNEIEAFSIIVRRDGIKFHSLTYQELIVRLSASHREEHGEYIKYLTERYL